MIVILVENKSLDKVQQVAFNASFKADTEVRSYFDWSVTLTGKIYNPSLLVVVVCKPLIYFNAYITRAHMQNASTYLSCQ